MTVDGIQHGRTILVSGIPASVKSCSGRWLERERDFLHLDVETAGVLEKHGLRLEWDALFQEGPLRLIARLTRSTVIDWGFPPAFLGTVRTLVGAGVQPWWFGGDRTAARQAFITRGAGIVAAFDQQMNNIAREWPAIEPAFG